MTVCCRRAVAEGEPKRFKTGIFQHCLRNICLKLLLAVQIMLVSAVVHAEGDVADDESAVIDDESPDVFTGDADSGTYSDSPFFDVLDKPQQVVSRYLENFVRSTDEFFANEKTSYASTGSYARITLDSLWSEGGKIGYAGNISVKVRLPATQGKLKLLLESDPQETQDVLTRRVEPTPQDAIDQKKYYAGLLANFGREAGWQFEPSLGLHVGSPIEIFARIKALNQLRYQDWLITFNNTLYWYDSTGTGNDTTLEFNYQLDKDLLARSTSFARWTHQTDYFNLSQVFSLIYTVNTRRAITYAVGVYGISEPTVYATDYLLTARFRQALRRENLFVELAPELRFRQINNFKDEYSLLIRLEWIFKN